MARLIPKLHIARSVVPGWWLVTCSHCPTHQVTKPSRPAADQHALRHEKAHLLGRVTLEED